MDEQRIQIIQPLQEEEEEINLKDYWAVIKRRWQWILLAFFIVVGLTAVYLIRTPRQYEAKAVVKFPASGSGGGLSAALSSFLPIGPAGDVMTEIEVIKGRSLAEKVIKNVEFDKKEENIGSSWIKIVTQFQKLLKVGQKGKTNLIEITASGGSPKEAKETANEVANEYIRMFEASSKKIWNNLISQMDTELAEAKTELYKSRQTLHGYEAKEGITTAFSPLLIGGGTSKEGFGTQYTVLEVPQAVAALKTSIMQMEIRLNEMRKYLPEANPEMISLKSQISESKQKLQQEENKAIDKYNKQFGLTKIAAEVLLNQQLYAILVSKQEELKAQYIMQNKVPEIVESAVDPLFPSKPKRKMTLMLGGVIGVFLGLGLALFREYLDNSIHTTDNVAKFIDIPVLGSIPYLSDSQSSLLITHNASNPRRNAWLREFYKESYRMLHLETMSSLMVKENTVTERNGKALLVTSSLQKEGKSIVAANLAISIAQTGKKVLLVDIDCRAPSLHSLLNLDAQKGLIDFLTGKIEWDDVTQTTSINNLYVITSGSLNDQNELYPLLVSSRMEDFIKQSKGKFDFVIFDSPPITLASESTAISSKLDGMILVIKANTIPKDIILHAKQIMQSSGGNILGAVLNCAIIEKKYYKYYSRR